MIKGRAADDATLIRPTLPLMKNATLLKLMFCLICLSFFVAYFFLGFSSEDALFFSIIIGAIVTLFFESQYWSFKTLKTIIGKTPKSQRPKIFFLYGFTLFLGLGFFVALIFIDLHFDRAISFVMLIGSVCIMFFAAIYLSIKLLMAKTKSPDVKRIKGLLVILYIAPIIAVAIYLHKVGGICAMGLPVVRVLSPSICGT